MRPGHLFTKGPGTYKIPAFDDAPVDMRVRLLDQAANPFAVHSSRAVGEPPFFMACSAFLAAKRAAAAARAEGTPPGAGEYLEMFAPATSEKLRMACLDEFTAAAVGGGLDKDFKPKGSY